LEGKINRPKTIVFSQASLDGRLTIAPEVLLLYGDARWQAIAGSADDVYARLMRQYQPQALLEGSGSLVLPGQRSEPFPAYPGETAALYQDFLPPEVVNPGNLEPPRRWLVVVDSGGRIRWVYKEFPGEVWSGWHILVLVSTETPAEYLAYLQHEQIPYLVAGTGRVNLAAALEKLSNQLGIQTLVVTGGGRLNGALLRAGLIDEVEIEFLPALIGGSRTPALFTAPDLLPDEEPLPLQLCDCKSSADGKVRLHYLRLSEPG
jgi:2,5-diamino-6-(ribosylamino)-4(3H)-pyrimidinone 5'-phosphate reductase